MDMAKGVQQENLYSVMKLAVYVHTLSNIRLERERSWANQKGERYFCCMARIRLTAMHFKEEY